MQSPKSCEHQWVIDCSRGGPDFLQSQRTNNAGILGQMRFIVPDESGIEDPGICEENETDKEKRKNQHPLPRRSSCALKVASLHTHRASRHFICELTRTITNIPWCATDIWSAASCRGTPKQNGRAREEPGRCELFRSSLYNRFFKPTYQNRPLILA